MAVHQFEHRSQIVVGAAGDDLFRHQRGDRLLERGRAVLDHCVQKIALGEHADDRVALGRHRILDDECPGIFAAEQARRRLDRLVHARGQDARALAAQKFGDLHRRNLQRAPRETGKRPAKVVPPGRRCQRRPTHPHGDLALILRSEARPNPDVSGVRQEKSRTSRTIGGSLEPTHMVPILSPCGREPAPDLIRGRHIAERWPGEGSLQIATLILLNTPHFAHGLTAPQLGCCRVKLLRGPSFETALRASSG